MVTVSIHRQHKETDSLPVVVEPGVPQSVQTFTLLTQGLQAVGVQLGGARLYTFHTGVGEGETSSTTEIIK